jgi:ribonuclease HII
MLTGRPEVDQSTAEWIIGSDEAGYGTWAGHLVVAAVAVKRDWRDPKVTDSKKYGKDDAARAAIVREYREKVLWKAVAVPPESIDEVGVWTALIQAHNEAHAFLSTKLLERHPEATVLHIVDGLENAKKQLRKGLVPMTKADLHVPAVSLASCFAKAGQCALMDQADRLYPQYGFGSHRGYHSPQHCQALERFGVTPIHRKSYSSVKRYLNTPTTPNPWELGADPERDSDENSPRG